jgi:hypothetical protein
LATLPFPVDQGSEMCLVGDTLYFLAANGDSQPLKLMVFTSVAPRIIAQQSSSGFVMTWSDPNGVFSLFTATNVAGPYSIIPGATSPYTNPIAEPTRFFLLKWE